MLDANAADMSSTAVTLLLLTAAALATSPESEPASRPTCDTHDADVRITKEEFEVESGELLRSCHGDIQVRKCEGTCDSQVRPSVVTASGFLKFCQCCRETWMTQREVLLTHCYDKAGQRLYGDRGSMAITVREPEGCSCHSCGDGPATP
ncbi:Bursb [Cordylochernes scorpioides]|uniref:Bursb n=1 Tax=Cordylochernes scorpioides TaxID=51811 RepID=A0ABY6JW31_9ARAC|nr:Bursb [Cordylochernes scorpioides]